MEPVNRSVLVFLLALAACQPPAADNYVERVELAEKQRSVGEPIRSPDTQGAIWAAAEEPLRLLYGKPGEPPLIALACDLAGHEPQLHVTRFARADAEAKALFAFVGNGHIARIPVDAEYNGRAWLWEGSVPADTYQLGALTGPRALYATLPGAGRVEINASPRPGQLIEACLQAETEAEREEAIELQFEPEEPDTDEPQPPG